MKVNASDSDATFELLYNPSRSFRELVFVNVGGAPLVAVMVDMLARIATIKTRGQAEADASFIQNAQFKRIMRIRIARTKDETLDKTLEQTTVMVIGRQLLGFEPVMGSGRSPPEWQGSANGTPRGIAKAPVVVIPW